MDDIVLCAYFKWTQPYAPQCSIQTGTDVIGFFFSKSTIRWPMNIITHFIDFYHSLTYFERFVLNLKFSDCCNKIKDV